MSNTISIESERVTYNSRRGYIVRLWNVFDETEVFAGRVFIASGRKLTDSQLLPLAIEKHYDSSNLLQD